MTSTEMAENKPIKEFEVRITRHIRVIERHHPDSSITWSVELSDGNRKPFKRFFFNDYVPALSLAERMYNEGNEPE
jgi:hypothetical protein